MIRPHAALAVALALFSAADAVAGPPTIKGTTPFGVRRGVATELIIEGTQLKGTLELIAPFGLTADPAQRPNDDAGKWKTTITVAPGTAIGVYPIRVRTESGLSNPILLAVGQLPQVSEAEDNSTINTAQLIPSPVVVEGQTAGNDVDYFKFAGRKGERIAVDALCARIGSGVDPSIRLTTLTGKLVASADDTPGLLTDARLWATLPEDTDYLVEISDTRYQGGNRPIYRLVVGAVPMAEEVYPIGGRRGETVGFELRGGTLSPTLAAVSALTLDPTHVLTSIPPRATAATNEPATSSLDVESLTPLIVDDIAELREVVGPDAPPLRAAVPVALNGRIDPAGDEDQFVLAVTPGQKLRIEVNASEHGSALDGALQVLGAKNAVLATADDTAPPKPEKGKKAAAIASPDPTLDFTVPAGLNEITLSFRDLQSRGGVGFAYRIRVSQATTTFELALDDAQVSIPRAGTAAVGVSIVRKGYNGPITLNVPNPPPGVTVRPGLVAEGQLVGSLTLSAAADASFGSALLEIVGQAKNGDEPLRVTARKLITFAAQGPLVTNKLTQIGLLAATSMPAPIALRVSDSPIEIAQGFGGKVAIEVAREAGADAALTVTSLPLPAGVTVPEAKIAEKKEGTDVVINATTDVPLGSFTIALQSKGKFGSDEHIVAAPELTLNVVRPVSLELSTPSIELKAGESSEVKGKVTRAGTCKEELTIKLNKLPAGLKAEPVKVAPDQTEFTIKVEAEPKAAKAEAKAEVVLSLQVAKKDYAVPSTPLAIKLLPGE